MASYLLLLSCSTLAVHAATSAANGVTTVSTSLRCQQSPNNAPQSTDPPEAALPPQNSTTLSTATALATEAPLALASDATSYTYPYTVTTPTTVWNTPTFTSTASPTPSCSSSLCPTYDKQVCIDDTGVKYGILCSTQFSGTVITNEDRRRGKGKGKRDYTGTLEECAEECDEFSETDCKGLHFEEDGYCQIYDTITGTFGDADGMAAIRQS